MTDVNDCPYAAYIVRENCPDNLGQFNTDVCEHLDSLDGSPESAVALLAGIPRNEAKEYER